MAYSDYGGYAYKDGNHILECSDYVWTPQGAFSSPGVYPGFAALAKGASPEEAINLQNMPMGHAVIGDSKFLITLYKQSSVRVYDMSNNIPEFVKAISPYENGVETIDTITRYFDLDDGYELTVVFSYEDNYYCYARLKQPDGHVWTAFSGYGVGAGHEDGYYGFSTQERIYNLMNDNWWK